MPLYTVTTQAGVLDAVAKARLANELATFHAPGYGDGEDHAGGVSAAETT
jgi:hypothetical protein